MANVDWIAIKNEYITTDTSYKILADKYPVSKTAIGNRAKKENWVQLKREYLDETCTKVVQEIQDKNVDAEVDRVANMLKLTDKAQEQIGIAFGQLDKHMDMFGNVHECEIIDVNKLKKLVAALKDIKEIIKEDSDKDLDKLDNVLRQIEGKI